MKFVAKTLHGLEPILAEELKALGASDVNIIKRAVEFQGDKALLYRANYELRTAIRVLRPIYTFLAKNEDQLYQKIMKYNWDLYLDENKTFAISYNVHSRYFTHSQYVALKMKDAIVDQFRNKKGKRPSVYTTNPDILLNVHVHEDRFSIALDSSGQSLHRRGYRDLGHAAPLNEVLAAGMIQIAGWTEDQPLQDPMCGTGTILLEAAMLGTKTPAAYYRKDPFCFTNWKDYDVALFEKIKQEANAQIVKPQLDLQGADTNPSVVRKTQFTLEDLNLTEQVSIQKTPFKRNQPQASNGVLITNPPYGERLKLRDINAFYGKMGDILKQNYTGWNAWIISSNLDALKHIGLKPAEKHDLFNGALECKFLKYTLF